MKSLVKTALLCSSLLMALTACTKETTKEIIREVPAAGSEQTAESKQIIVDVNDRMSAAELANAGEQLVMPQSAHLAYKVFSMALEKDPENAKAKFYYSFLARVMKFEGILTRLQPYVDKFGDRTKFSKMIADIPNHSLREFLLTPKKDAQPIRTAADIQSLLVEYRKAVESFRAYIVANQDTKLDLYLNPYVFAEVSQKNLENSCEVSPGTENDYTVTCNISGMYTMKVNMADMMALKQFAAGEIAYLSIYTSYSVGSIESMLNEEATAGMTSQAIMENLDSAKDFGHLMKDQGITALRKLGADLSVGIKWAMKYQSSLCRIDAYGRPMARRGFLVGDICANNDSEAQKSLQVFDNVLAGVIGHKFETDDGIVNTRINPMAIIDRPVVDVRSFMPATWSQDGSVGTSLRDNTLGGAFPNQDADLLFKIK